MFAGYRAASCTSMVSGIFTETLGNVYPEHSLFRRRADRLERGWLVAELGFGWGCSAEPAPDCSLPRGDPIGPRAAVSKPPSPLNCYGPFVKNQLGKKNQLARYCAGLFLDSLLCFVDLRVSFLTVAHCLGDYSFIVSLEGR